VCVCVCARARARTTSKRASFKAGGLIVTLSSYCLLGGGRYLVLMTEQRTEGTYVLDEEK
jgi:hypothetical protein